MYKYMLFLLIWVTNSLYAVSIKDLIDSQKIFALKHIWIREGGRCIDIDLSNMGITSLDGFYYLITEFNINPAMIRDFDLSNNKITKIPLMFMDACPNLERLLLQRNRIAKLPKNFLAKNLLLEGLDLSHNQLKTLPEYFLENNTGLIGLVLSHNKLDSLPRQFLHNCTELKVLFLNNNNVHMFPKHFLFNNRKLQKLTLYNNPASIDGVFPAYVLSALTYKELRDTEVCSCLDCRTQAADLMVH